ncbi:MAG: hypothetical protein JNL25_00170, partial [Rhodospirillaceae bacterium]|nr:hypothetical protein [Rhodospirillaceae bacterium]
MTAPLREAGSFRDPNGHIYHHQGRILRTVNESAAADYRRLRDDGLLALLVSRQMLLPAAEVDPDSLPIPGAAPVYLLEHPRLPFVSYPYEWSFAAHRAAALLHLDLHLLALEHGFTLSDASAYNVQFIGARPIFIDHLSLRPYRAGEIWAGHRQFCMQFLNPLLLHAKLGINPQTWFRGQLEGIDPADLARILPWRQRLSWTVFANVFLQARFQSRAAGVDSAEQSRLKQAQLPASAFRNMLIGLRDYIAGLKGSDARTTWSDYAGNTSYSSDETARKQGFVAEMVAAVRPEKLIDLGCNTGDYSKLALQAGAASVIGFD